MECCQKFDNIFIYSNLCLSFFVVAVKFLIYFLDAWEILYDM